MLLLQVDKAEAAARKIRVEQPGAQISTTLLDLGDLASVRTAAARLLDKGEVFDVVLNNAGAHQCFGTVAHADGQSLCQPSWFCL